MAKFKIVNKGEDPGEGMYTPPHAHRFTHQFCGDCPHIHVLFFDEDEVGVLQAVFSLEQIEEMRAAILRKNSK